MKNRDENMMLFIAIILGVMFGMLLEYWLTIKPITLPYKKMLFHALFAAGETFISSCTVDLSFQQIESIMYKRRKEKLKNSLTDLVGKKWKHYPFEPQFDFYRNSLKCIIYGCGGYFISIIAPVYTRVIIVPLLVLIFILIGSYLLAFIERCEDA